MLILDCIIAPLITLLFVLKRYHAGMPKWRPDLVFGEMADYFFKFFGIVVKTVLKSNSPYIYCIGEVAEITVWRIPNRNECNHHYLQGNLRIGVSGRKGGVGIGWYFLGDFFFFFFF